MVASARNSRRSIDPFFASAAQALRLFRQNWFLSVSLIMTFSLSSFSNRHAAHARAGSRCRRSHAPSESRNDGAVLANSIRCGAEYPGTLLEPFASRRGNLIASWTRLYTRGAERYRDCKNRATASSRPRRQARRRSFGESWGYRSFGCATSSRQLPPDAPIPLALRYASSIARRLAKASRIAFASAAPSVTPRRAR